MKLKVGNKVYLQKYEVAHIMDGSGSWVPSGIIRELYSNNDGYKFMNNLDTDGFRFDCVFEEPRNVAWLMRQDWIVSYNKYANISLSKLETNQRRLKARLSVAVDEFYNSGRTYAGTNFATGHDRLSAYMKAHFIKEHDRLDKLGFKIASLGAFISFRKGEVEFVFPDGYHHVTTNVL